jgi:hypothetical protein
MAVPGVVNYARIKFDQPHVYQVLCHEYCGWVTTAWPLLCEWLMQQPITLPNLRHLRWPRSMPVIACLRKRVPELPFAAC